MQQLNCMPVMPVVKKKNVQNARLSGHTQKQHEHQVVELKNNLISALKIFLLFFQQCFQSLLNIGYGI